MTSVEDLKHGIMHRSTRGQAPCERSMNPIYRLLPSPVRPLIEAIGRDRQLIVGQQAPTLLLVSFPKMQPSRFPPMHGRLDAIPAPPGEESRGRCPRPLPRPPRPPQGAPRRAPTVTSLREHRFQFPTHDAEHFPEACDPRPQFNDRPGLPQAGRGRVP